MTKKTFIIRSAEIRDACREYIGAIPLDSLYQVEIKPYVKSKSSAQRRYFHAFVSAWAKFRGDDPKTLKVLIKDYCDYYGHTTHPKTGKVITYLRSSEDLTMEEYAYLITQAEILAAKQGFTFEHNQEYEDAMS